MRKRVSVCFRDTARYFWAMKLIFGHKVPRANTSSRFPQFFDISIWKILDWIFMIFEDFLMDFATFFTIKMQQKFCFFWNLALCWKIQSQNDLRKLGTDRKNIYRDTLHLVSKNFIFLIINHTIFALKLTWREIFFQYAMDKDLFMHSSQLS